MMTAPVVASTTRTGTSLPVAAASRRLSTVISKCTMAFVVSPAAGSLVEFETTHSSVSRDP
jgi:hypothetical protein